MKYSFDDYAIGLIRVKGGRALETREIRRPAGIAQQAWFTHASAVCAVLNKIGKGLSHDG